MATDPLDYLNSPQICKISIPSQGGRKILLDCLAYRMSDRLVVEFMPGRLPVDTINTEKNCLLSVDTGSIGFSLSAAIEQIEGDRRIILNEVTPITISREQTRDFFRVDTQLPVNMAHYPPKGNAEQDKPIVGEAINISGSGIMITFPGTIEPFKKNQRIKIDIPIPEPRLQSVTCLCTVMRVHQRQDGRYVVGFKFDTLEDSDQDKIIGYCLALQREQLRLKVRILGTT